MKRVFTETLFYFFLGREIFLVLTRLAADPISCNFGVFVYVGIRTGESEIIGPTEATEGAEPLY